MTLLTQICKVDFITFFVYQKAIQTCLQYSQQTKAVAMCSQPYDVLMLSINSMAYFLNLGWFLHIWKYRTAERKWHLLVSLIVHSLIWLKDWTRFIYCFCHDILFVYLIRFVSRQFIYVVKLLQLIMKTRPFSITSIGQACFCELW